MWGSIAWGRTDTPFLSRVYEPGPCRMKKSISISNRRSVYADRLREFSDFAFGDDDVFTRRGTWREFFLGRIGPTFDGRVIFEVGCADAAFVSRIAARHPNC